VRGWHFEKQKEKTRDASKNGGNKTKETKEKQTPKTLCKFIELIFSLEMMFQ